MNWFFIALFGPVLWAASNHIDKYLLSRYVRNATAGALILVSATFGLFALPFIFIFDQNLFQIGLLNIFLIAFSGILYIAGLIPYFYALQKDEASVVIPIFQTIPVFGFIYAFFVLGEVLTTRQLFASLLVIGGAVGISLDLGNRMPKLKKSILFYMLLASATFAGVDLLFKFVAIREGFWTTMFWHFVGYVIFAVFVLLFLKSYREQFINILKSNGVPVLGLNAFNETLNLVARGLFGYATLLAPPIFCIPLWSSYHLVFPIFRQGKSS